MEPLTALSLAASIAQFLEFGSKLIGQTNEVAKAGSTVSIFHFSNVTSDLISINATLERQLNPIKGRTEPLTKEEQVSRFASTSKELRLIPIYMRLGSLQPYSSMQRGCPRVH